MKTATRGLILLICVYALHLTACAFSNTNPFTGETRWTIGDACNDCAYDENGYPTDGQASGPLSEAAADALKAALEAQGDECDDACQEDDEPSEPVEEEAAATGLAPGVVELPEDVSDELIDSTFGPQPPPTHDPNEGK